MIWHLLGIRVKVVQVSGSLDVIHYRLQFDIPFSGANAETLTYGHEQVGLGWDEGFFRWSSR